ncbi:MAG: glucose 1-dehydrogenase [Syntrophomonadaceae bacterium]|nr:glucose 1-dehydrogenase [Syntrophomonadaceae bacterium]
MKLEGKVAIVTGAGSGIGRAIALGFAREGASIAVADINMTSAAETVSQIEAYDRGKGIAVKLDIAKIEDNQQMVDETVKAFGRVDILVNNAGLRNQGSLFNCTPEIWEHAVDGNLRGLFWAMKAVTPIMIKQGMGKIINISSLQGVRQCNPDRTAYCSTKTGLISLTRAAAVELGPYNICVNAISPGTIETNMGGLTTLFTPEVIAERCKYIPLRYRAKPEALIGPALFLASDDSDYVTGINMVVDGGWCASD